MDPTAEKHELVESRAPEEDISIPKDRSDYLRPIMWRVHFIGGFLGAPVVVALAVTGILFAWNTQIDDFRFGTTINANEDSGSELVMLAEQVQAAQNAHPDWGVFAVTPGQDGKNTAVLMDPPGGEGGFRGPEDGVDVYVDQSSGEVTGEVAQNSYSQKILRGWHSSFGIGERAEPITELAGSWFLVSLLTGVYLWWPNLKKRGIKSISVRRNLTGRRRSKEWHNLLGMALLIPMMLLVVTGLTWTQYAGERVDTLKKAVGADTSSEPFILVDPPETQADVTNINGVYQAAQERNLETPIQIGVPQETEDPWEVRSMDTTFPLQRDVLMVNGSSGQVVDEVLYADEHWFNQLRTGGILFHQAQLFGWPLRVFMSLLAVGVIAMVYYGYKMWWQRKPADSLGVPPAVIQLWRTAPVPVIVATVLLGWLLPMLGVSLVAFLAVESLVRFWKRRPLVPG